MKDNDSLHERLQEWHVHPTIPPRFQAEVWAKIAARETERGPASFSEFLRWLFPSPVFLRFATVTAMGILAIGVAFGQVAARSTNERHEITLAQHYAASIDPYLRMAAHPMR